MSDTQINTLLDELEAMRKRAEAAEEKAEALQEATQWMAMGINPLTSDEFIPDAKNSTILKDEGPIKARDAAFATSLYAIRHGVMMAYSVLRENASEELRHTASGLAAGCLNIEDPDLIERSMTDMLKMAMYLKARGVEGATLPEFPL